MPRFRHIYYPCSALLLNVVVMVVSILGVTLLANVLRKTDVFNGRLFHERTSAAALRGQSSWMFCAIESLGKVLSLL